MLGNLDEVLARIGPTDRVLDVGGGLRPIARADVVLDSNPMANIQSVLGGGAPRFSEKSWIVHDVNDRRGFPFGDNEFDFVFCSHLLEDIRDPVFVCQEIARVGKRGYIEVPSRESESSIGIQSGYFTGYMHHRWFVEHTGGRIVFTHKSPLIHEFPILQCPSPRTPYLAVHWEGEVRAEERLLYHSSEFADDLIRAAIPWHPEVPADEFTRRARAQMFPHEHPRSPIRKVYGRLSRATLRLRNAISLAA